MTTEFDFPFMTDCKNCDGFGNKIFQGVTELNYLMEWCEKNHFILLPGYRHEVKCLICNGAGKKELDKLSLE